MFLYIAALLLIAGPDHPDQLIRRVKLIANPIDPDRFIAVDSDPGDYTPASEFNAYDNLYQGIEFRGVRPQGAHEVGDDIHAVPLSGGHVSNAAWSIFNNSPTQNITIITFTLRFYTLDGVFLGDHVRPADFFQPITPGTGAAVLNGGAGSMLPAGIVVPDNFYFTITFSDALDFDVTQAGVVLAGPPRAGSSTRFYRDFTLGQDFDTGSSETNLLMFVRTVPIPAPATLLALPLLALLPRRRARPIMR